MLDRNLSISFSGKLAVKDGIFYTLLTMNWQRIFSSLKDPARNSHATKTSLLAKNAAPFNASLLHFIILLQNDHHGQSRVRKKLNSKYLGLKENNFNGFKHILPGSEAGFCLELTLLFHFIYNIRELQELYRTCAIKVTRTVTFNDVDHYYQHIFLFQY